METKNSSEIIPQISNIDNRLFILSPTVKNGLDRESTNHDFYRESEELVDLGKLGFGTRVCHKKTQLEYIILNFDKENIKKANLIDKINNTLNLMYSSNHCYLYRLLNHYEDDKNVFLIMESYDGESLKTKILNGECEDSKDALKYFTEICIGLQQLHTFGMYNINITPETILIDICVKLTDFNLKMIGKNDSSNRYNGVLKIGNHEIQINSYTTPEELKSVIDGENVEINSKTDSWNLGILLYEMLTGFQSPFKTNSLDDFINSIKECEIDLSKIENEFCKDLISKLLKKNQNERMDVKDLLDLDEIIDVNIEFKEVDEKDNIINFREVEEEEEEEENLEQEEEEYESDPSRKISDSNKSNSRKVSENYQRKNSRKISGSKNIRNNSIENDEEKKHRTLPSMISNQSNVLMIENNEMFNKIENHLKNIDKQNDNNNDRYNENINNDVEKKVKNYKEQADAILKNFENLDNMVLENLNINNYDNFCNYIKQKSQDFQFSNDIFKELVNKLLSSSEKETQSLLEENKKKIEDKVKIFNNILNNLKKEDEKIIEASTNELYYLEIEKKKKKKDDLIQQKYEYMQKQIKEEHLKKKLKIMTEQNKILDEYINIFMIKKEENTKRFKKIQEGKQKVINQLYDIEEFITKNYPNNKDDFLKFIETESEEKEKI